MRGPISQRVGSPRYFQILRRQPHGAERVQHHIGADICVAIDHHMRKQPHAGADFDIRADLAPGPDLGTGIDPGGRIDDCGGMDHTRSMIIAA